MNIKREYTAIKSALLEAVSAALPVLADELKEEIQRQAEKNVYTYGATPEAMATRRWEIAEKENLSEEYGEDYVSITNITEMQGTDYGIPEVDFVEQGLSSYQQPYPREFMNAALEEYIRSGKAEETLRDVLANLGFDANVTVIGE